VMLTIAFTEPFNLDSIPVGLYIDAVHYWLSSPVMHRLDLASPTHI
jgi:hypothetical protein